MKERIDTVSNFEKINSVRKKRKIIIIVIIAAILVLGGIVMKKSNGSILVESLEISNVKVKQSVSASGKVKSSDEADLAFAGVGRLEYIHVKKGDTVSKGQLIGYITNYSSTKTAEASKNARDVANANFDIYVENYQTNLNAVGGKDEYELNLTRLRELLAQAEATYQASLGTLSNTYLYASFEGTVVDVYKEQGEVVGIGETIVKIVNLNSLTFEVEIDQEDFGLLGEGQLVEITLDAYEDEVFSGVLGSLPKYADDTSEEFELVIFIDKDQNAPVLFGMAGDAKIIVAETEDDVAALIFDSIYTEDNSSYVWIEEDGKGKKLTIETGLEGDLYTQITTDLSNVNLIEPSDLDKMHEDVKVKYKSE